MVIERPDTSLTVRLHPSPNTGPRRDGAVPRLLVLHYTGMTSAGKAIGWLANPESGVSCHYVVDEAGGMTQMVAEERRAWHAGRSFWAGETDINSHSIGIEIHNPGHDLGYPAFPEPQMAAVAALCRDIIQRWRILPRHVLAHSDIAPARKADPGEKFPWAWLAEEGVGLWAAPGPPDPADPGLGIGQEGKAVVTAQRLLQLYGYGCPVTGCLGPETACVLRAFQRHFRPARVDGRLDGSTLAALEALTAAAGVAHG